MGQAKELITMDVYADNRGIIADGMPEIEAYYERSTAESGRNRTL